MPRQYEPGIHAVNSNRKLIEMLRRFVSLIAPTAVTIPLVAASMTYVVSQTLSVSLPFSIYLLIALVFLSIYLVNRNTDLKEDAINDVKKYAFSKSYGKYLSLTAKVSFVLAVLIASALGVKIMLVASVPFLLGALYSIGWPSGDKSRRFRLKQKFLLKNLTIAAGWAVGVVGLSGIFAFGGSVFSWAVFAVFIFLFMRVFINTIVFDMRDVRGDEKNKIITIPVRFGIARTKRVLIWINSLLGIGIFVATLEGVLPPLMHFANLSTFYTYGYIRLFGRPHVDNKLLCDVVVDGEYIAMAIFVLAGELFLGYVSA